MNAFCFDDLRRLQAMIEGMNKVRVPIAELESICALARDQGWSITKDIEHSRYIFTKTTAHDETKIYGEPNDDRKIALASACWKLKHSGKLDEQ